MRFWSAMLVAIAACGLAPEGADEPSTRTALLTQSTQAAVVAMTSALTTPSQRHVARIQPPNHAPVHLMAVQNDGYSLEPKGLLWYRSDDGGTTWRYYRPIVAQPDPAAYDASLRPTTLHLTADVVVVGNDVAAVYSFDSTLGSFPADGWDPRRVVYFQWWRYDGANDWVAGPRVTIASPASAQAYRRALIARDGLGRLWVQAFLRRSSCNPVGSTSCVGDVLRVWVSTNGGASFQGPQDLATLPNQLGGGRLISVGSQLLMLWSDYSTAPARLMRRNDSDALTQWGSRTNAFPDGSHVYHGSAMSAARDGRGGLHLVYKKWIADPERFQLYYRYFDGAAFGPARTVGGVGDWATQPAITATDDDLYVCVNHVLGTNTSYEIRSYRLSRGFSSWDVIDSRVDGKAYPSAPERVPASAGSIPCAFGMGNMTTSLWGAGHTVQVAQQPAGSVATSAAAPTFSPAPGTYSSAQAVSLSSATSGATIYYTTDGSTPTTSSTRYAGPITVSATRTIRAIATATGFTNSAIASGTYTIQSSTATLFSDDFSRTSGLGSSWRVWFGSYSTDGSVAVSGSPPAQGNWASLASPLGTSDYAVAASLSIPAGALYSGVVARSSASDFTRDLYSAQISASGAVNLYRRNGWTWTLLGTAAGGVQANRFHTVQLVTTGVSPVHLEVWLDGARLITHDDASASRLTSGAVGVENYDTGVRYDSFRVLAR